MFTIRDSRRMRQAFGVLLAVLAGVAIAVQARINGQLAVDLDDAVLAALISFAGGLLVLAALLALLPKMRSGVGKLPDAVRAGALHRWHLLGGLGGATMVASQAITVDALGVATFTVGIVAGQTVSGLAVDRAGLGPAGPRPVSARRLAGAALVLCAVAITMWGGFTAAGSRAWLLLFPLVAGIVVAVQQAVNGRVGAASGNAMTATLVNFVVGTAALLLGWLLSFAVRGGASGVASSPVLYAGGLIGITFIALAALVVRWIGVLLLGLAAIAGQLIGSVLLDVFVPSRGGGLVLTTVIGVAVALFAIGVAAAPARR